MLRGFIGWVGTIVVALVASIVLVTILTPLLAFIERYTGVDLVGHSWPNDSIYLWTWIILTFVLHYFVFKKKRYKKRAR